LNRLRSSTIRLMALGLSLVITLSLPRIAPGYRNSSFALSDKFVNPPSPGNLPLRFEDVPRTRTPSEYDFVGRSASATFFLSRAGATLLLRQPRVDSVSASLQDFRHKRRRGIAIVKLALCNANPQAKIERQNLLSAKTNYLVGKDPGRWRTNVSNYAKISYRDVFPGTDISYFGDRNRLEYDFTVNPGANPAAIALDIGGADKVSIDAAGNLRIRIKDGELVQRKPFAYQEIGSVGRPVSASYELKAPNRVGFRIGNYDVSKPLVIDPVLAYSTYVGGAGNDQATGIALDSAGKAYITGVTTSTDFPINSGTVQPAKANGTDLFVTKLNATGTAVDYSTYIGGNGSEEGLSIAIDLAGRAYVTGFTNSTDFPVTSGSFQSVPGGGGDAFVVKLNTLGTSFGYSTYLGGSLGDEGHSIAVDSNGSAYVTGVTDSGDYPVRSPFQTTKSGTSDAFVSRISPSGDALSYSTFLGGSGLDWGFGIVADSLGNIYVAGATDSSNFPVSVGSVQSSLAGSGDGFIAKLNPSQAGPASLSYATYLGGGGFDMCSALSLDESGNVYLTGLTDSANFPVTAQALQRSRGGASDAFAAKLNALGSTLLYSTYLGGSGNDWGRGVTVDADGQVRVAGSTESSNFPTASPLQANSGGKSDAFIVSLNAAGTGLNFASYLGGTDSEDALGVAANFAGNEFLVGATASSNFPVTAGALRTIAAGNGDGFLAKFAHPEVMRPNHIDDVSFFVRRHYLDFLSRDADASGFAFWSDQLTSCGSDVGCAEVKHINVSASFFLSIEFQQTGFLVYRFSKVSYNRMPRYELFLPDVQEIGHGVVVLAAGWEQLLESNKRQFADNWVKRPEFRTIYDSKSNAQYVDALFSNAGVVPGASERAELVDGLNAGTQTRATVLRAVVENATLQRQEFNPAFVLVQYFGYLRRNPDDPPDGDLRGFNFWLTKLNQFDGNFINAEMVKAFLSSIEYRQRFGP